MSQRNNHPQPILPSAPDAPVALLRLTAAALILALVLITGPISAEYGFA